LNLDYARPKVWLQLDGQAPPDFGAHNAVFIPPAPLFALIWGDRRIASGV